MSRRFSTAITITLVVFTLLPVSLVGTALVRQAGEAIRTDAERDLQMVAQSLSERLTQQLSSSYVLAHALAGDTDLFLATRSMLFWRDAKMRLNDFLEINSLAARIVLIDNQDNAVVAIPEPLRLPIPAREMLPEASSLITRNLDPSGKGGDSLIKGDSLFLSLPIRTQSGMPGRARILFEFSLKNMRESASSSLPKGLLFELRSLEGGNPSEPTPKATDQNYIRAESRLRDLHFGAADLATIWVSDHVSNRFRVVNETIIRASTAIVALAIVAAVLAFLAARYFLSPLAHLLNNVEHISEPGVAEIPTSFRFHEFQVLGERIGEQKQTIARQFDELNQTVENLRELNERLHELRSASEQSQLNALKAQMNPHLLFNTLNSILSMMDIDVLCASKMVSNLADLYRLILGASKKTVSDLGTEVRVVSLYLELERIRFADRMTYRIDVPPAAHPLPIPGLLLQTLVENAVKHGIAKTCEGGDIELRVSLVQPGKHLVRISNSGGPLQESLDGAGTGVANTRRRLELLYGAANEFRLYTNEQGRTVAEFFIVENGNEEKNSGC